MIARRISTGVAASSLSALAVFLGAMTFCTVAGAAGGSFGGGRAGGFASGGANFGNHGFGGQHVQRYPGRAPIGAFRQPALRSGAHGKAALGLHPGLISRARVGGYGGGYFPHPQNRYGRLAARDFRQHRFGERFRNRFDGYGVGGFGSYGGYGGYSARSAPVGADGYQPSVSYGQQFEPAYAPPRTTRIKRGAAGRGSVAVTTQEPGFQSEASYNLGYGYSTPRSISVSR